jgi:hypothetical protein
MSKDSYADRLEAIFSKAVRELGEHFEAGLILCTYKNGSATNHAFTQFGNAYAVEGLVYNIREIMSPDSDDDDGDDLDDGDLKAAIKKLPPEEQ